MADTKFYTHLDLNSQQLKNAVLESVSSDPGTPSSGQVWYNTTENRAKYYDGTAVQTVANLDELNAFGAFMGAHDASLGALPSSGSGVGSEAGNIQAGDYWRISVAGTIAGIEGSDILAIGDVLIALTDSAAVAANFLALQSNADLVDAGQMESVLLASLLANTPTAIPTTFSTVRAVRAFDSSGDEIQLLITSGDMAESNVALTNVTFHVIGN